MEKTCSSPQYGGIVSKTNRAEVLFKTNSSRTAKGWSLEYGPMPECMVLDPSLGTWNPGLGALRMPRSHSSVISSAKGVYIIGGTSSPFTSEFLPLRETTSPQNLWESGPNLPISMIYGCAVSISSSAFMIIYRRDVRVFEEAFDPAFSNNWMAPNTWPKLRTGRYHPGCAVIHKTVVIAGGFSTFSSSPGGSGGSEGGSCLTGVQSDLQWCTPQCDFRTFPCCCFNQKCEKNKPYAHFVFCGWMNAFRQGKTLYYEMGRTPGSRNNMRASNKVTSSLHMSC